MLKRIGRTAEQWVAVDRITNVYGLARTLIALGTLTTLLFTKTSDLFPSTAGTGTADPICFGHANLSIYCLTPDAPDVARWLSIAVLVVVASGYRPRFTGILHWWMSFSLTVAIPRHVLQGGDEVAGVLTLLLIPATLVDARRWHWKAVTTARPPRNDPQALTRLLAGSSLLAARAQVAAVYLVSSLAKIGVKQWGEGTALYYYFQQPIFPTPGWVRTMMTNGAIVKSVTWGTLALELLLAAGLFAPRRVRPILLTAGIVFHAAIAMVFALPSFALVMWGALILLYRPFDKQFLEPPPNEGHEANLRRDRPYAWAKGVQPKP